MASNYWIKLYHEILDDPKMGQLPDRLWRRAIELFLMAGETNGAGYLPCLTDMAWKLRISEDALQGDLNELATEGIEIVEHLEDGWFVKSFAKRQAAMSSEERGQRFRARKRQENYYGTSNERNANEDETENERNVLRLDTDTDKIRLDTDAREKESRSEKTAKIFLTPD